MIDLKLVELDFDNISKLLGHKKVPVETVKELKDLILKRKELIAERDNLRAKSNSISKEIQELHANKEIDKLESRKKDANNIKREVKDFDDKVKSVEDRINYIHLRLPNTPDPESPIGDDEDDNVILRYENYDKNNFKDKTYKPHWEIGKSLGILDLDSASKISGSMFALYRGFGAKLLRALVKFGLDLNADEYEEILPPHFVTSSTFTVTGHLPKFETEAYKLRDDDLWAIPTGEVPLMSLGRDHIFSFGELPKKFMAYTVCFRREAGAHGKDTRGTQRLHEFHKVELLKYVTKEHVREEFNSMLEKVERALTLLGLPYRVVNLCTGDLTFSSSLIYDIEVYAAGVDKWLEASSVGIFTDFQARRGNIRHRNDKGKLEFINAINGSGMATPRVWAAIIENYQQPDGSVVVPEVLREFMGTDVIK